MDGVTELAKLFKERENSLSPDPVVGEVISLNPLEVRIHDKIIVKDNKIVINKRLVDGVKHIITHDNGGTEEIVIVPKLEVGNELMILPTNDYKRFFVLEVV